VRLVALLPTYNEADNIEPLLQELLALGLGDFHVLVVDDDSPDGTAEKVAVWQARRPQVHLLLRRHERGRGSAGRDGFLAALELGAEAVVEMDADRSHRPEHLPDLIAALADYDLVVGSRRVPGGSDSRGPGRRLITRLANLYLKLILNLPVSDATSGYRAYRAELLRAIDLPSLLSPGPAVLQEVMLRAVRLGFHIGERPIRFVDRSAGRSTLSPAILLAGLRAAWRLRRQAWPPG